MVSGALPAALQLLLDRTKATVVGENQWEARCPAHDDRSPSLSIALGSERPVVATCHAGCTIETIAAAAGIDVADFSRLPPADEFERDVERARRQTAVREEARRRDAAAGKRVALPAFGLTLADALMEPQPEVHWAIEDLLPSDGNAVIAALLKAGKTTLALNLAKAFADQEKFLGRFPVRKLEGRVAYLDYELSQSQAMRWWHDLDVAHPDRIARPIWLRGENLNFWDLDVQAELAAWMVALEVEVAMVDPAARAMRPLVDDENSNSQVAAWTDALDALKKVSGIRELVVVTHFGKGIREEDQERARGASRLEDWADAILYLSKEPRGDSRWLRAMGRDVDVAPLDLRYDQSTRQLTASGQSRDERRATETHLAVVDALALAGDGASTRAVEAAMDGKKDGRTAAIKSARDAGLIRREYEDGTADTEASRPGKALKCFLTKSGRQLHRRKVKVTPNA